MVGQDGQGPGASEIPYLEGNYKHNKAKLFLVMTDGVKSDNNRRLLFGTFRVDTKKSTEDSACGITILGGIRDLARQSPG